MGKITKKELLNVAKEYYGIYEISNTILQNYIKIGLIERVGFGHERGIAGSVSYFPKNTPGILHLIRVLQDRGIKLSTIKKYMDLIKLDSEESLKEIKRMIKEHDDINSEIGTDLEIKNLLSEDSYKKILQFKRFKQSLTEYEIFFNGFIELRAYAELDYNKLPDILTENLKKVRNQNDLDKIQNNLDNPDIEINIDVPEKAHILVTYKEPFNMNVLFTRNKIEVLNH
jgi:DNA-binding transcriptional MerR regulator